MARNVTCGAVSALIALGNAGDASMLSNIRRYVDSDSEVVRAAVAQALRRIPGGDVDPLLAKTCSAAQTLKVVADSDANADLRTIATNALTQQNVR